MNGVLRAALELGSALLQGGSPEELLENTCSILTSDGAFRSAFAFLNGDNGRPVFFCSSRTEKDIRKRIALGEFPPFVRKTLETPGTVESDDWTGHRLFDGASVTGGLFVRCQGDYDPEAGSILEYIAGDLSRAFSISRETRDHREAETLLAEVYQNAPLLILLVGRDRRILQINAAVCDFTGKPASEMTGLVFGQAMRCLNSMDDPLGCGHGPSCADCAVRNAVIETLETGCSHFQLEAVLPFEVGGTRKSLALLVSTSKIDHMGEPVALVTILDITERKAASDELREAHSRLSTIMEITNTRIDIIDEQFNLVYVDPGWRRIHGDPSGVKCYTYFMGIDAPCLNCGIPRALETGETQIVEQVLLSEDNRVVEVHSIPFRDAHGRRLVAEFNLDITRRKKLEEELREGEKYLRSIFRAAPIGIGIITDRVIGEVNPTMCAMTGYSREELLGAGARMLYPDEDEFVFVGTEKYRQIAAKGTGTVQTRFRRKDGQVIDVLLSSTPIDPSDPSRGVTFTALDVTGTRLAAQSLLEKDEYNNALFNSINDGVLVNDADTMEILDVNDTVCRMYGYTREEVIHRRIAGLSVDEPPFDRNSAVEHLKRSRHIGPQVFEWKARHKSGKRFWVEVNATYAEIVGKPRFIVTVRDVSDRKAAEEERLKLERQISQTQKLESLGVLAGGIAHDFNNILMIILGNAQLAAAATPRDSQAGESIQHIELAARRASELCSQMLAYSGRATFSKERVDLAVLVKELAHLLGTTISKKAELHLDLANELPTVLGDPAQLRQIVMNLIINASEALMGNPGEIKVRVGLADVSEEELSDYRFSAASGPGTYVMLEVADNGCGMDEEAKSRVFEPFFTTKFTGRGLGLVAVLGIIRGHGAGILLESAPGEGTVVRVLFPPLRKVPEAPMKEAGTPPSGLWNGHGNLLLVDDEEELRGLGVRMLSRLGFHVVTASDGQEAVDAYRQSKGRFRGVILDLTMPRMDGLEACTELNRMDPCAKVVLMSGFSSEDVVTRFEGKGIAGFLQKPFTFEDLKKLMSEVFP
ncbi:MAG: PAS domain S-box protein [Candidatus Fermentibacteraceae bacterium]